MSFSSHRPPLYNLKSNKGSIGHQLPRSNPGPRQRESTLSRDRQNILKANIGMMTARAVQSLQCQSKEELEENIRYIHGVFSDLILIDELIEEQL